MKEVTLQPVTRAMWGENEDGTIVEGYMCLVDYECELGGASGGNVVYPSLEDIRERRTCISECGIVKVAVVAIEIVQEPNYDLEEDNE